jgi:brefeldin A-resistance guanine nucleotide exchange factor 1
MKKHLKLQLEQILISTHLHILGDLSSSPDQQEIALESLLEFSRESSILLHLYVSYDADLNCSNLFEDLFISLANSATPLSRQPMNLLNYLAMDCVLEVVYFVSCRCFSSNQYELLPLSVDDAIICNGNPGYSLCNLGIEWLKTARDSTAQMLQQRRRAKKRRSLAADYFNAENKWMSKVESLGILPVNLSAKLVAQFLHENPRLDKRRIGELLSKGPQDKYPFHAAVLREYASRFDFRAQPFHVALRNFLSGFHLPGEAQCIDRLMEVFAGELYSQWQSNAGAWAACPFSSADAAFVLAFSTIMLQTDLHNPAIAASTRLSADVFVRNNRVIHDGDDLPHDFLWSLYQAIKDAPIPRPVQSIQNSSPVSTGDGTCPPGSDKIVSRGSLMSLYLHSEPPPLFSADANDYDMFQSISEAILSVFLDTFHRSHDEGFVLKLCAGFRWYAQICEYFDLSRVLDRLLTNLLCTGRRYVHSVRVSDRAKIDSISSPQDQFEALRATIGRTGQSINRKFLAFKEALEITSGYGHILQDSWQHTIDLFLDLADRRALPVALINIDDTVGSDGKLLAASTFALRCRAHWTVYHMSHDNNMGMGTAKQDTFNQSSNRLWSSISLLWRSSGHGSVRRPPSRASPTMMNLSSAFMTAPVEAIDAIFSATGMSSIYALSANYPLGTLLSLLSALLARVNPEGKHPEGLKKFEARAALALEHAWRVIVHNQHRATSLWPLMHAQVSHLMSCGLISGLPYLAERSMVILLRANAVLLRKNTRAMLSRSLRLIHQLSHNTLVHVADRLALGLLDLLRMKQWKLRLLVPLLAEADKHRKGQPYVAAAALVIVGDLPQAISFAKTWTTCRQLILGNIHRFNDPWGTEVSRGIK